MSGEWSPKFILGYTSDETILLDFDEVSLETVKYWSRRALRKFNLGGFIMLQSSPKCYHVVFNRKVSWTENMQAVAWVALLSKREKLRRWFLMQCIKQKPTLRVSPKAEVSGLVKPSPRLVCCEGSQDDQIAEYLEFSGLIQGLVDELSRSVVR